MGQSLNNEPITICKIEYVSNLDLLHIGRPAKYVMDYMQNIENIKLITDLLFRMHLF